MATRPRVSGLVPLSGDFADENARRIARNFSVLGKFAQDIERLWPVVSTNYGNFGLPFLFGDGSDGVLTVTGTTSLDENLRQYETLTINSGATLNSSVSAPSRLILFVRTTLTVAGTIDMNEKGFATGVGNALSYGGTGGGGGGSSGNSGTDGGRNISQVGGSGGGPGVAGDSGTVLAAIDRSRLRINGSNKDDILKNSLGGGGGNGGDAVSPNGIGGVGGGCIFVFANQILITSTGIIRANGGTGAAGGSGNNIGGGGGGAGGIIYLVSRSYTNLGSVTALGGSGGAAGTGGGGSPKAGGSGSAGTIITEIIP